MEVRLNKAIADSGYCSRRKADELIEAGRVKINNVQAEQGQKVLPTDCITIDNEEIGTKEKSLWLMLHKPVQVVSTVSDPQGRATVLDFLPEIYQNFRIYPVGRLDYFSEGLILLTNEGELANRLMHPRYALPRKYLVRVREDTNSLSIDEILDIMKKGMTLKDTTKLEPVEAKVLYYKDEFDLSTDIEITLYQGVNRQIRRMCQEHGLTILRLMRISHGDIELGDLPKGKIRQLTLQEINQLKCKVGL